MVTIIPTLSPLNIPPLMKPNRIVWGVNGEISSSSMFFWNLDPKNVEDTFVYELVIMDIIIKPGIINSI